MIKSFFTKKGFFLVFRIGIRDLPTPPSCTPGSVAEYASVSLYMLKYP